METMCIAYTLKIEKRKGFLAVGQKKSVNYLTGIFLTKNRFNIFEKNIAFHQENS